MFSYDATMTHGRHKSDMYGLSNKEELENSAMYKKQKPGIKEATINRQGQNNK